MLVFEPITALFKEYFDNDAIMLRLSAVSGGDIHQACYVELDSRRFFVKLNDHNHQPVIVSEFNSLQQMHQLGADFYPRPIFYGESLGKSMMVMSYHALTAVNSFTAAQLGYMLAEQHQISHAQFGWSADNYIGLTPQQNRWTDSWLAFYRDQRLVPQLKRAVDKGLNLVVAEKIEVLISRLSDRFDGPKTVPSLLHGDLWNGNVAFDMESQQPLLYDPAPYFGDREADIAMTELFGCFPDAFYAAYREVLPLRSGYVERKNIYHLYHALNHFNLFGSGYEAMVDRYSSVF